MPARLGHVTGWARAVGMYSAAVLLSACGVLGGGGGGAPAPTAVPAEATAQPNTSVPSPVAKPSAPPAASPTPTTAAATAVPAAEVTTVWVGNTEGQGAYVRNTPVMADRNKAYADGTPLTVVGDDVDDDGQHWKHVRTPDGLEGYVPSIYTVDTQP